jgi:putative oxidoreductase
MQPNATTETRYFIPGLGRFYGEFGNFAWAFLRILYGAFYIPHGMQKLFGAWGGGGMVEGLAKAIDGRLGWHPGIFWAYYIGCLEFFGGILLVLGLLTRPVALLFCGFMFVAAVQFNTQAWWWTQSGREMPLLLLGIALVIVIRGGGPYSLDRKFGREF